MDDRTAIQVPETTAQAPMGLAVPPEGHQVALNQVDNLGMRFEKSAPGTKMLFRKIFLNHSSKYTT